MINPILLQIGPLQIHWYGIMYLLAFLATYLYLRRPPILQKIHLQKPDLDNLLTYLIAGVILGGRLGYVLFYNFSFYLQNPLEIPMIWLGGMSFHGGVIGVILATYLFCRSKKIPFLPLTDQLVRIAPLGLFFGRLGNFINGELYGRISPNGFCINFATDPANCRYPSQLFQALGEGLLLFILLNLPPLKKLHPGQTSALFLIGYGILRLIAEFWREPDAQIGYLFGAITLGQLFCIIMIVVGISISVSLKFRKKNSLN